MVAGGPELAAVPTVVDGLEAAKAAVAAAAAAGDRIGGGTVAPGNKVWHGRANPLVEDTGVATTTWLAAAAAAPAEEGSERLPATPGGGGGGEGDGTTPGGVVNT